MGYPFDPRLVSICPSPQFLLRGEVGPWVVDRGCGASSSTSIVGCKGPKFFFHKHTDQYLMLKATVTGEGVGRNTTQNWDRKRR